MAFGVVAGVEAPFAPTRAEVEPVAEVGPVTEVAPVAEVAPVDVAPLLAPVVTVTAGIVTVVVAGVGVGVEFPASATSEAASTPSDTTATSATPTIGAVQRGDAASRVRAAPPHCRHQS